MNSLFALFISLSLLLQAAIGGNVLCLGENGHVAIEPPHKTLSLRLMPVAACDGVAAMTANHHGPCEDLGARGEVTASRWAPVVQPAPSLPAFHAGPPEPWDMVIELSLAVHRDDSQSPPPSLAVAHSAVLLI